MPMLWNFGWRASFAFMTARGGLGCCLERAAPRAACLGCVRADSLSRRKHEATGGHREFRAIGRISHDFPAIQGQYASIDRQPEQADEPPNKKNLWSTLHY